MKSKLPFCMVAAGFLSGIAVLYLFVAWPFSCYVRPRQWGEIYKNVNQMTIFFADNKNEFKLMELYFKEDREWDFTFHQYKANLMENGTVYYYRTMGEHGRDIYYDPLESDESSLLSENLKEFLDFTAGRKEILSVVLHSDYDIFDSHQMNKRYLEVRCHEGEEVVSYLYAPQNQLKEDNWEQLIELENGWYLGICQYIPIKLKGATR